MTTPTPTTKSLLELVDERPQVDNQEVFDALWQILVELRQKVNGRFELQPHPSTADLQPYHSLDGRAKGFLSGFTGPEIDWLVHSWIGTPQTSFTNMHLTIWLGPQVRTPHFGLALGTMPDIFVYMDYVPRTDLMTDLEYLDRYYQPVNDSFVRFTEDGRFSPFVSKALYMRQSQSHTSHCYLVAPTDDTIATIRKLAHQMMDRWLGWLDDPEPTPAADQPALAQRDQFIRRAIAERDPANAMGVRLFGEELTNHLVRALWGADRAK
ncbi:MAG: red chlorophyll catabolite reductase [Chloroflexota bacterium]